MEFVTVIQLLCTVTSVTCAPTESQVKDEASFTVMLNDYADEYYDMTEAQDFCLSANVNISNYTDALKKTIFVSFILSDSKFKDCFWYFDIFLEKDGKEYDEIKIPFDYGTSEKTFHTFENVTCGLYELIIIPCYNEKQCFPGRIRLPKLHISSGCNRIQPEAALNDPKTKSWYLEKIVLILSVCAVIVLLVVGGVSYYQYRSGIPGPPFGPLVATDVTLENCSLSWKPPAKHGRSPITNYIVEKQALYSKDWIKISINVQECHYEVFGLEPYKSYAFRVSAKNRYGIGPPLTIYEPITAKFRFDIPSTPKTPQIISSDNSSVYLIWKPSKTDSSKIHGYQVECTGPSDGKWKPAIAQLTKQTFCRVTNLTENSEYQFRLKTKNIAGFSEPSKPTAAVTLKRNLNVSSPSLNLRVVDVGKDYAQLEWDKPGTDAESKISGYVLEHCEKNSKTWKRVDLFDCWYTVPDLMENQEYEFKVVAVNSASRHVLSSMTIPIKVPDPAAAPKIRKCPSEVFFPENNNGKIKVLFFGTFPISVQLFKYDLEVKENRNLKLAVFDEYAIFYLQNVQKSDEGKYKLILKNDSGVAEARFILHVAGNRTVMNFGVLAEKLKILIINHYDDITLKGCKWMQTILSKTFNFNLEITLIEDGLTAAFIYGSGWSNDELERKVTDDVMKKIIVVDSEGEVKPEEHENEIEIFNEAIMLLSHDLSQNIDDYDNLFVVRFNQSFTNKIKKIKELVKGVRYGLPDHFKDLCQILVYGTQIEFHEIEAKLEEIMLKYPFPYF